MSETRRVTVCGTAPSSLAEAPFDDPEVEIWGTSRLWKEIPRADAWFELHPLDEVGRGWDCTEKERRERREEHIGWLAEAPIPVYLQAEDERIPSGVRYPLEEIREMMAEDYGDASDYFTNTISYMLAFCLYAGVDEVGIYGVDMALDCLGPNERILTADLEWVAAKDVHEGDKVLAFDEHTGNKMPGDYHTRRWRVAEVEGRSTADRPSYRIHLEDGRTIVASKDHRWLTYGEHQMRWKRTEELVTDMHRPGRPTRIHSPLDTWQEDRSWQAGYLAAAFDGEGSLGQTKAYGKNSHALNLGFSQRENGMADKVRAAMAAKGFEWSESATGGTGGGVTTRPTIGFNVLGGRSEILRFLGQIRPRRLMENFDPTVLGQFTKNRAVAVEKIEPLGEVETVGFTTSTGTMVVEGLASHNSEYQHQRPSVEYWLGVLRGAGVTVHVPSSCDLLQTTHLYGYEWDEGRRFLQRLDARMAELDERTESAKAQLDQLAQVHAAAFALKDHIGEILGNGYELPEDARRDMSELVENAAQQAEEAKARAEQLQHKRQRIIGAKDNVKYVKRSFAGEVAGGR